MESVGDVIKRQTSRFQYQDLVQQIMKRPRCGGFCPERIPQSRGVESASPSSTNISQKRDKVSSWGCGLYSAWLQAYLGYESRLCGCVL